MKTLAKEIEETLFSLPLDERARLADKLLGSLEDKPDEAWFESWDREILDRVQARECGEMAVHEGQGVMQKLWKTLER